MESTLTFEATVEGRIAQVSFGTEPPDAAVGFDIEVDGAGLFLGRGRRISTGERLELSPADPGIEGTPPSYGRTPPGVYIRAVRGLPRRPAELSDEALERLRALGYVD